MLKTYRIYNSESESIISEEFYNYCDCAYYLNQLGKDCTNSINDLIKFKSVHFIINENGSIVGGGAKGYVIKSN